jgi:N-acyl-D-aspartate/D-glutamate deacylase
MDQNLRTGCDSFGLRSSLDRAVKVVLSGMTRVSSQRGKRMHDLVIRNGSVVDGTGGPARAPGTADIAVDGERITEVGQVDGKGRREIDAHGRLVTPGFVDIHTHYDGQVTWDPEVTPTS